MTEKSNRKNRDNVLRGKKESTTAIRDLIADLKSKDGIIRQRSRQSLVAIGRPSVACLVKLMKDRNDQVRWEATKALAEIGDPAAASSLTSALEDEEFDIRWLAAEGLIALKLEGLSPLLKALTERPQSVWLREGAHHVLRELAKSGFHKMVQSLLETLEDMDAEIELPEAATELLNALGKRMGKD
jgi:HEAT repeat protein